MTPLEPDRDQIARFVEALFRHAKPDGFVSLRSFTHDDKVWRMRTVRLDGSGFEDLISAAVELAAQCANADERIVFCPPLATFKSAKGATEDAITNGIVLSVECDTRPDESRWVLEELLGCATVITASGGEWTDPETGEVQDKKHLHWRLSTPTRTAAEHAALKEARGLACRLAGADATAVPIVHPMRWPGSWHRKGAPRLARIVGGDPEREITLQDALTALREAVGAAPEPERVSGEPQAPIADVESWLTVIPNPNLSWDEWNRIGMATWAATGCSEEGFEQFDQWSKKSTKYNQKVTRARWDHFAKYPPTKIGAGTLAYLAEKGWAAFEAQFDDADWEVAVAEINTAAMDDHPERVKPTRGNGSTPPPKAFEPGWPAPLGEAAYHGLAGDVVRTIEPHSEADPAALLIQFLAAYGSIAGRRGYCLIDGTEHHANLFAALVGDTSAGRKGTSLRRVVAPYRQLKGDHLNIGSGLSSGEGLVHAVRDPISKLVKNRDTGEMVEEVVDPGVDDKRLLVIEEEFSRVLRVMARPENTLSTIIRAAWDGADLGVMTRQSPLHATEPHISIIAHTTAVDLAKYLTATEAANGYVNRFLLWCVRRSKSLPFGGTLDQRKIADLVERLESAVDFAAADPDPLGYTSGPIGMRIEMDDGAGQLWKENYDRLTGDIPGMLGEITARGAPYVRRIALIYTMLDRAAQTRLKHLEAALEVWRYAWASAAYIFGGKTGDALADEVLRALRETAKGMSRTEIYNEFGRHKSSADLTRALDILARYGLAVSSPLTTGGRPSISWRAT